MIKKTLLAFSLALQNVRANLFHTLLSILGIVIGVAALVAILSFIDGLEKFAKDQISGTTSLNTVIISTDTRRKVGSVSVQKDSFAVLDYDVYRQLTANLDGMSKSALLTRTPAELRIFNDQSEPLGTILHCITAEAGQLQEIIAGRKLSVADVEGRQNVIVVNEALARQALKHDRYAELPGQKFQHKNRTLTAIGVVRTKEENGASKAYIPVSLLARSELRKDPPTCYVEATSVEKVEALKTQIEERLKANFKNQSADFSVLTNDFRVKQAAQGFALFRIIMGLIVGISILVGGIGVMNVLLISVKERTSEIGIRKAVGANRGDIMRLFLAESVTIAAIGSFIGLLFGLLITAIANPIIKMLIEMPFQAIYTCDTFITIAVVALLVGIIFGTYPAMKAAKLDPVEAIRRE